MSKPLTAFARQVNKLKKASSLNNGGVSLMRRGRFFNMKKRPLCLLIEVSTHLSVGREAESEASFGGQTRASVPTDSLFFK